MLNKVLVVFVTTFIMLQIISILTLGYASSMELVIMVYMVVVYLIMMVVQVFVIFISIFSGNVVTEVGFMLQLLFAIVVLLMDNATNIIIEIALSPVTLIVTMLGDQGAIDALTNLKDVLASFISINFDTSTINDEIVRRVGVNPFDATWLQQLGIDVAFLSISIAKSMGIAPSEKSDNSTGGGGVQETKAYEKYVFNEQS